jgi:prepilin-type N-terminal cleavage/methylation domain-containing protein
MQRGAGKPRGVTFLELMVVLVILAVFCVFSFPVMKGTHRRNQMKAAVRDLVLLAKYARQEAVLRGKTTELRLDISKNRYRLALEPEEKSSRSSAPENKRAIEQIHELDPQKKQMFFKSVESATDSFGRENIAKIRFFSNGSASPSTIVIQDGTNERRQMTIEIAGASGAARAYNGPPQPPPEASPEATPEATPEAKPTPK